MGMTLKPISFWSSSFKVREVIEATHLKWFNLKSLKRFAPVRASLYEVLEDGTFYLMLEGGEFVRFKQ